MKSVSWFAGLCILAAVGVLAADAQPSAVVLYPPDGSVLKGDLVLLMAIAAGSEANPQFTLDGKPIEAERMAFAPTWAFRDARLAATTRPAETPAAVAAMLKDKSEKVLLIAAAKLSPGEHVFAAGSSQSRITLTQSDVPKDARLFHLHQPVKDAADALACDKCHTVTTGSGRILGLAKVPGSCESCHEEIKIQLAHNHVLDSLKKCSTCHDPHGSTRAKLLIAPQEKLCTTCHEAGHSKR